MWRWQSLPVGKDPDNNLKATPLMIDGVLYTSTGLHQAAAIDPRTGATLWTFSPEPREIAGRGGVPPSGRGLAYWTDGREKRVFDNTLDGRLISIDARTGQADPKFGNAGTVLLKEELTDRPVPMVGSSSPPIVVGRDWGSTSPTAGKSLRRAAPCATAPAAKASAAAHRRCSARPMSKS